MAIQVEKQSRNSMIREIEYHLKQYRQYKVGISNFSNQIELILPRTTTNEQLRESSSDYARSNSSTEDCALEWLESKKLETLQREIQKYNIIVNSMEQSLDELDELERKFVEYRYFQRWPIRKIALELGYSESSIHMLRRQLMEKLLISLKGILSV